MSFSQYPEYRDSGVEWLGEVPAHWYVAPLASRFDVQLGKMLDTSRVTGDHLRPYLRAFDVQWGRVNTLDLPQMDFDEGDRVKFALRCGDLLVNEGGTPGRAAIWDGQLAECYYQKALHRLRPKSNSGATSCFLYRVFEWAVAKGVFAAASNSATIEHLPAEKLRRHRFAFPPLTEQLAISTFLDRETTKIDALVAEQRRLVELLKEKRQAVIAHAVTKGLSPDAPMKPSGVEWLGEVPAHWEVARLGALFHEVAEPGLDDLPILSVSIHSGVSDGEVREDEMERKVTRSEDRTKYKRVEPGDLVYNMMRAWQGAFGAVTVLGMVSPAYVVARPRCNLGTQYVEHLLRSPHAIEEMRRNSRGITDFRLRLYWDEFKDVRIAVPPVGEAVAICASISEMDGEFDALT
ncbi:MAG: restriction endonuclease subunit S, partial [Planctomycetes bacterium]|nr:restriction endonuclease subunit S [Planctomycetota bacterium]